MPTRREWFDGIADDWDNRMVVDPGVIKVLLSYGGIKPGDRVLDVGAGTGVLTPQLLELVGEPGRILSLDFSERMLEAARGKFGSDRISYLAVPVDDIPLPDGSVDVAVCFSVLPHFEDIGRDLGEIARVLVHGGRILICHANSRDHINARHRVIGGPVGDDSLPPAEEVADVLSGLGFEIETVIDDSIYVVAATVVE